MSQLDPTHDWDPDDPLLCALRTLPRHDLSPELIERQRARLHAELARVSSEQRRLAPRLANLLEPLVLGVCAAMVVVRIALALLLFVRAGS